MRTLTTHRSILDLLKQIEEKLYKARTEMDQYSREYEKLNAKLQHANEMRDLLLTTVEAMAPRSIQKASLLLLEGQNGKKLDEKKPFRMGNIMFYLDQDYQGELEALGEVVEGYKKRVFLLEKAAESLSHLKPGRERSLRVIDEDGIPLRVLIRN